MAHLDVLIMAHLGTLIMAHLDALIRALEFGTSYTHRTKNAIVESVPRLATLYLFVDILAIDAHAYSKGTCPGGEGSAGTVQFLSH
jgi:hypothetical protein